MGKHRESTRLWSVVKLFFLSIVDPTCGGKISLDSNCTGERYRIVCIFQCCPDCLVSVVPHSEASLLEQPIQIVAAQYVVRMAVINPFPLKALGRGCFLVQLIVTKNYKIH